MGKRKLTGPGVLGSMKAVKKTLKKGGQPGVKNIPSEDSLTVRPLDEPHEWAGYFEHWINDTPVVCTNECAGCDSDDPDEQRKGFKYLMNAYVHDDQKVWAVKMPKTLGEQLIHYFEKNKTLLDRDYDLSKTGSGKTGTKYMAAPESPKSMKISRFDSQKHDLDDLLEKLMDGEDVPEPDDEDDEPVTKRPKSSKFRVDDDDDEPVRRVKKKSGVKKSTKRTTVKRKK